MKGSRVNPISKRKAIRLIREYSTREALCARCGGMWVDTGVSNHRGETIPRGYCSGGCCELCGQAPDFRGLHPHEDNHRSQGGELSLENSQMACGRCHSGEHGINESGGRLEINWIRE